jgi:uncharacterized protein YecT (DUF1311 family)
MACFKWRNARLGAVVFVALSASAQDDETKCCCTTLDTNICLVKVQNSVDSRLNETYQSALKQLGDSTENVSSLKDAERKWLAYRDATCKAESDLFKGGTIMPQIVHLCIIKLTKRRLADIKDAYLGNR